MIQIKQLISELAALKFTPWYRWHPQLAIRYLPVVEKIKENPKLRILEVGSGGLGIAPYLKRPVMGVDIKFEPPIHYQLKPIIGTATDLKFKDNSFDAVISMDMLEHLPKQKRQTAILEMLRVAKSMMVIGVPCGKEAEKHDRKIHDEYKKKHQKEFRFSKEQLIYGLPEETDILHYIKKSADQLGKKVKIRVEGNMNIKMREFLMSGWISDNWLTNVLFRKVFLLFIPLFRLLEKPPYYRKVFFIEI